MNGKKYSCQIVAGGILIISLLVFACSDPKRQARKEFDAGMALAQQDRPAEALTHFDKACTLDPSFAEAFFQAGNSSLNLGQFENALSYYDKALAIDSTSADAFYNRGNLHSILGKEDESCRDFAKAFALGKSIAAEKLRHCAGEQ